MRGNTAETSVHFANNQPGNPAPRILSTSENDWLPGYTIIIRDVQLINFDVNLSVVIWLL